MRDTRPLDGALGGVGGGGAVGWGTPRASVTPVVSGVGVWMESFQEMELNAIDSSIGVWAEVMGESGGKGN